MQCGKGETWNNTVRGMYTTDKIDLRTCEDLCNVGWSSQSRDSKSPSMGLDAYVMQKYREELKEYIYIPKDRFTYNSMWAIHPAQ